MPGCCINWLNRFVLNYCLNYSFLANFGRHWSSNWKVLKADVSMGNYFLVIALLIKHYVIKWCKSFSVATKLIIANHQKSFAIYLGNSTYHWFHLNFRKRLRQPSIFQLIECSEMRPSMRRIWRSFIRLRGLLLIITLHLVTWLECCMNSSRN